MKNPKVFIISEIGINHEGDFNKCLKMIDKAKKSGSDAVKLQIVSPDQSYPKNSISHKIFTKSELSKGDLHKIFKYAKKKKIKIFATCDTIENVRKINKYNPFAFKVSSGLSNNIYILKYLKKLKKKIFISVGLLKINEINNILNKLKNYKNIILMHSISRYPTINRDLNLNSIDFLKKNYKKYKIGYSDHTKNDDAIITSIAKGCSYIEKHFTFDKKRKGFDHSISYDYKDMLRLKKKINTTEIILGKNVYNNYKFQKKERLQFLRYVVTKNKIFKNNKLKKKDVKFMRVKNGSGAIDPINLFKYINKKLRRDIDINCVIKGNDFK